MSDLPPDAPRLRAILAHLDKQLADNEAVATYLRLQRDSVLEALERAEGSHRPAPAPRPRPPQPGPGTAPLSTFTANGLGRSGAASSGFVVERQPQAAEPEPARIHTADCPHPGMTHPISAHDARAALVDASVIACAFCQPDQELGIDLD